MKIVNKLNGRLVCETSNLDTMETTLEAMGWIYDETTDCIGREERNIAVSDLAVAEEMHYGAYKRNYRSYRHGEYNAETKTIVVYIPIDEYDQ